MVLAELMQSKQPKFLQSGSQIPLCCPSVEQLMASGLLFKQPIIRQLLRQMTKSNYIFGSELALTHQEGRGKLISELEKLPADRQENKRWGKKKNATLTFPGMSDETLHGKRSREARGAFYLILQEAIALCFTDTRASSTFWKQSRNSSIIYSIHDSKCIKRPLGAFFAVPAAQTAGRQCKVELSNFNRLCHSLPFNSCQPAKGDIKASE